MPHSSTIKGTPASPVTVSTIDKQPWSCANFVIDCGSVNAPVDVSAWTEATIFVSGCSFKASSILFKSTFLPQSSSITIGIPPNLSTFSFILSPKKPFLQIITLSFGSTKFAKQHSIPAIPGADTAKVNSFLV